MMIKVKPEHSQAFTKVQFDETEGHCLILETWLILTNTWRMFVYSLQQKHSSFLTNIKIYQRDKCFLTISETEQ